MAGKYRFEYTETIGDRSISINTDVIYPCITAQELSELIVTIHELLERRERDERN